MADSGDRQAGMLDLVARVYDAALDDRLWPALAPQIAQAFEATSTAVFTRNLRDGAIDLLSTTANYDTRAFQSYASYYAQHDVWAARAAAIGLAQVFTSKDLVEDSIFERTEVYNDFCKSIGDHCCPVKPFRVAGSGVILKDFSA